ncbi:phage tail tape measure protein [Nocardia rhamnosiphila]|uniref:phage tail tape measure protein n=1 Tax=Nocardia rhamnosiphila TaxID=426716 RepID=UPI0033CE10CB
MAQDVFAYTTLAVIPTLQGSQSGLESQLAGPMTAAGRSAGQQAGQAIASGLDQARGAVEAASARLAQARDKEADAAGKVRVAEARLQELRDSGRATASQIARAEEALETARRGQNRAANASEQATRSLEQARENLASATDDAVESEGAFSRMLGGLNDRLGGATKQMLAMGAATVGVGSAMAAASDAISREQTVDVLAAQLGATPEAAATYGQLAGDLYKQGLGESFADVSQAVGAVQSALAGTFDDPKQDLQDFSKYALDFNKTFGVDTAESIQVVSQLIGNEFAANGEEAFDLLTTSFQRVPAAMRDELPAILNEYGTHFRGLGFSGEQAFALLTDYAGQGAWALDKAGDALKEFTLLGSDMSQSSQDAYKAIGLDAQAMSTAVASGGAAAQDALQKTAQGLLAIEDPAELANTAIALFGTPVEDLAIDQIPAFLGALTGGSDSMAGFAGAADQMGSTLNNNTATSIEKLKRELQGGLVDSLTSAANWIDQNRTVAAGFAIGLGVLGGALIAARGAAMGYAVAQGVMAAAQGAGTAALAGNTLALGAYTIATGVIRGATMAWSGVQWLLNAALSANPIGLLVVGIGALIAGIVLAWQHSETFRNIVMGAWEGIKNAASAAWGFIQPILSGFVSWITDTVVPAVMNFWHGVIEPAFNAIGAVIGYWWDNFASPMLNNFKTLLGFVGDVVLWFWNSVITPAFDAIGAVISWWWNNIVTPAFDGVKAAIGLVGDAFMFFWNSVITPVFDGVGTAISWVWDNVVSPIFDKMKSGIGLVGEAFGAAGGVIKTAWNGLQDILRPVVHFLGGLLAKVPSSIAGIEIPGAGAAQDLGKAMQAFRTGGLVSGPGTGTSDDIFAMLSNREYVVNAVATGKNLPLLEAINSGWTPPPWLVDLMVNGLPGFASGGLVDLQNFARGEVGKPYQWAGTGNPSWDCSGIAGALYALATGQDPNKRYFTTDSDFAALGFKPGMGGPNDLSVGTNGLSGSSGHMASTAGDLNVEANASDGVEAGAGALGAADFPNIWHMALGGDPGGALSPGGGLGAGTGGGAGGLGGSGAGSSSSGGSASGGTAGTRPAGDAVPVWVDNWPSGFGSSGPQLPGASSSPSASSSPEVGATTTEGQPIDRDAAIAAALDKARTGFADAGNKFLEGQLDGTPFGGIAKGVQKQGMNITLVVADVAEAFRVIEREKNREAMASGSRF